MNAKPRLKMLMKNIATFTIPPARRPSNVFVHNSN